MKVYTVGVIGCGRIASLLEQETHRGNQTHMEDVMIIIIEPVSWRQLICLISAVRLLG